MNRQTFTLYITLLTIISTPFTAEARLTRTYVPDATLQRLADNKSLSDGLYKLNDPANGMVVYLYKQGDNIILRPVAAKGNTSQNAPSADYPLVLGDPKRQEIYNHLDKAGMASYKGNNHEALNHYEQAESLINHYVQRTHKGKLEITIRDADEIKG